MLVLGSLRSPSLPMRGEWIEIMMGHLHSARLLLSLPMRGEWIEIVKEQDRGLGLGSLPMRGEWIEISAAVGESIQTVVSPHAGRVD